MIEPTDEMVEAFREADQATRRAEFERMGFNLHLPTLNDKALAAGLAAVLAIVERDRSDEPGLMRAADAARRIADRLDEQAKSKSGTERMGKLSQAIGARLVAIRLIELADAEGSP